MEIKREKIKGKIVYFIVTEEGKCAGSYSSRERATKAIEQLKKDCHNSYLNYIKDNILALLDVAICSSKNSVVFDDHRRATDAIDDLFISLEAQSDNKDHK